jgi:hypothetical protein
MKTLMQCKTEIEQEFDEPLRDVVEGFAQMSYSRRLTAEVLGVTPASLRSYCHRAQIRFDRSPKEHREIRGRPPRLVRHAGREQSLSAWAWDLGISVEGVRRRLRVNGSLA